MAITRGVISGAHAKPVRKPLHGLDAAQCRLLNMRHIDDDYWCSLTHGEYTGKHTAINDEHADTIELRTFDCWYEG